MYNSPPLPPLVQRCMKDGKHTVADLYFGWKYRRELGRNRQAGEMPCEAGHARGCQTRVFHEPLFGQGSVHGSESPTS